jgi:hypothetical protein
MKKTCLQSGQEFEITEEDLRLMKVHGVEDLDYCYDVRLQHRLAFYNRRNLYKRKCDLTGDEIISIYSPDKPYKAHNTRDWYSDKWDATEYGRDFDFSRPFFDQFNNLMIDIPHNALAMLGDNINSDYSNDNYKLKNCYLIFDGEQAENCFYGETFGGLKDCSDFLFLTNSELCYQCSFCEGCYNLKFSRYCKNSSNSWFLRDCIGCKDCVACCNLVQKQYCIFNKQYSKEEYERIISTFFNSGSYRELEQIRARVEAFFLESPVKALRMLQVQNSLGDNLANSKNAHYCFDCFDIEDCRYCTNCLFHTKDSMDLHGWGEGVEQCFNSLLVGAEMHRGMCCSYCFLGSADLSYCVWCSRNAKDCFGSVGLMHKQYCILNKQYSKEAYEALLPKIIKHMKDGKEWGRFFPPEISPFGYNESLAMEYFPLNKQEVLGRGWKWSDYEAEVEAKGTVEAKDLQDDIADVGDKILDKAILCAVSGKPFKVVEAELAFYRKHKLPLPRLHPDERHKERFKYRNPFKLYDGKCAKTGEDMKTTYSPDSKEKIYSLGAYKDEFFK